MNPELTRGMFIRNSLRLAGGAALLAAGLAQPKTAEAARWVKGQPVWSDREWYPVIERIGLANLYDTNGGLQWFDAYFRSRGEECNAQEEWRFAIDGLRRLPNANASSGLCYANAIASCLPEPVTSLLGGHKIEASLKKTVLIAYCAGSLLGHPTTIDNGINYYLVTGKPIIVGTGSKTDRWYSAVEQASEDHSLLYATNFGDASRPVGRREIGDLFVPHNELFDILNLAYDLERFPHREDLTAVRAPSLLTARVSHFVYGQAYPQAA